VLHYSETDGAMLDFLFGFNARLGRLHFFLGGLVLAVLMTLICFAIAAYAFGHTPRGAEPSYDLMVVPALFVTPFFLWATFTLQAMRIRDIGWDPVTIIPAWVVIVVVDAYVAAKIPAWSAGKGQHETIVGLLINLASTGILLFWPSGAETGSTPDFSNLTRQRETTRVTSGPMPARAAANTGRMRTEFGQRGL
jgi:uncharacterized membrane protein YhaH (DUF805 family)